MQKAQESPRSIKRAEISWQQSKADLKVAKSALKKRPDKSSLQSTQSVMNALSSILEAYGYFQLPTFSAIELLDQCVPIDPNFEKIRDACHVVDGTLERDMFGTTRTPNERFTPSFAKACLEACEQVQKQTKIYLKQNKSRFFSP